MTSTDPENVIEIRGLVTSFGNLTVHDHLDLSVRRGEVLGLIGGSGSGKSVLLNTILGLRAQQAGSVSVLDLPADADSVTRRQSMCRRIGVMFQGGALFSALDVRDNVAAPMREHTSLSEPVMRQVCDLKVALVGLEASAANRFPSELSGGMRKRASLARALALDPELLFLDEPTAGLDPIGAEAFDQLIGSMHAALGLTVVMITHDLDSLYAITDRVAVIADGKIVAVAPCAELEGSNHPWIRQYFNGPRSRVRSRSAPATPSGKRS